MPIISVRDNENNRWKRKKKHKKNKQRQKTTRGEDRSYSERVRAKWFYCAFKLGFIQLICKASLIFKLNLGLALSIILKQRELYELKHVVMECRSLKIWDLLSFLICSSILVLKWWQLSQIQAFIFEPANNKFCRSSYCPLPQIHQSYL